MVERDEYEQLRADHNGLVRALAELAVTVESLTASVGATRAEHEAFKSLHTRDVEILNERIAGIRSEWDPREALQVLAERLERVAGERDRAVTNCQTADRETAAARKHVDNLAAVVVKTQLAHNETQGELKAARQELTTLRVVIQRIRSGQYVRCLACQGAGCDECVDARGTPRCGVAGFVDLDMALRQATTRGPGDVS